MFQRTDVNDLVVAESKTGQAGQIFDASKHHDVPLGRIEERQVTYLATEQVSGRFRKSVPDGGF